jgi:hypothetical protein
LTPETRKALRGRAEADNRKRFGETGSISISNLQTEASPKRIVPGKVICNFQVAQECCHYLHFEDDWFCSKDKQIMNPIKMNHKDQRVAHLSSGRFFFINKGALSSKLLMLSDLYLECTDGMYLTPSDGIL